jgi:curved DNA-binding protein CbpA
MSDGTYYTVLGISDTVTQDEIDRAYRSLIEAYRVLSDSTQRSSYDQQLALHRQQYTPTPTAPPKAALTCPLYPEVFSKQIGCSVDEAKDFLAGRLPITPALARKLQSEFGSSLEFWMSQPFEEGSMNFFTMMAIILFFIGLGYAAFILVAQLL